MTRRGEGAGLWAQAIALGFALALAPAVTALCVLLLLPGIAAWYIDQGHGKPMGRTVLAFGIAGAFAPIWQHIQHDQTTHAVLQTAIHSPAIGTAWATAAAGWLVGRAAQFCVGLHLRLQANDRIRQLRVRRQVVATEWDLDR